RALRDPSQKGDGAGPGLFQQELMHASARLRAGDHAGAEAAARAVLARNPRSAQALGLLGIAAQDKGRLTEAVLCLEEAARLAPGDAGAHCDLGAMYNQLGRVTEAVRALRRALELEPDSAIAHANMASVLNKDSHLTEGIEHCRRAIELRPAEVDGYMNLGYALNMRGQLDEAREQFRRVLELDPRCHAARSNYLYSMSYSGHHTPGEVAAAHFAFGGELAAGVTPFTHWDNTREPERKLRIGYISPDFRGHSVALFLQPILEHHDRERFDIYCYSVTRNPDFLTKTFQSLATVWRELLGTSDEQAADIIRGDRIDILVDLAGHTSGNRVPLFARKPAPVSLSYLGYPNTTGLEAVDYFLADEWTDPPGEHDALFSERLFHLPRCLLCYRPQQDLPPVGPLPARANGYVTFGSFNNLPKYTPQVIALWSDLLKAVPNSRLRLKAKWFVDEGTRELFHNQFIANGVEGGRVDLIDFTTSMNDLDIALDPFPYNGATTTCQALWMGLPVVSWIGKCHSARVTASLLNTVGLGELAVETREAYIAKAAELAGDLDRLAEWRAGMRARIGESPLRDEAGFTRALEDAFRTMWRAWC
ncbi:tetratricopeptide repeat protein, partial [Candidatus Poribacteria bacterium]|nr:tetratricopeptide repeat protein [Candidatus Poribacteria bacterium]